MRTKASMLLAVFLCDSLLNIDSLKVFAKKKKSTVLIRRASKKDSSVWTIRVDGEIVAMELFSEVAWHDNI